MTFLDPPLRPRNGRVLHVLIIARISTINQDRRSLDEQASLCKQYIAAHYKGTVKHRTIASQGSGEILDRKELHEAEALVESGTFDLVIVEDLARLCRRNRAIDFCELCEDHTTRFIAINDNIDTAREDWRVTGLVTSFTHEQHNTKASRRLKDRLRERFKTGGAMACVVYGYVKPPHATSDEEVKKDPRAEAIYDEWFRLLEGGASFSEVADWLNRTGVKPGPYARAKRWDGRMVARTTFNPILKGVRQRNNKITRRVNKTGRRRSFPAPPGMLLERSCPHLAFIEPARYDRVVAKLRVKNAGYARGRRRGEADARKGVSKKRTVWPGQHLTCGVCNRLFYWGGHGVKEHMMCSGSRDYRCWNAVTFDGHDAGRRLSQAILAEINRLPDFDQAFKAKLKAQVEARRSTRGTELAQVGEQLDDVLAQIDRVTDAIARAGELDALVEKLRSLTDQRNELVGRQAELRREPDEPITLPTMDAIRREARKAVAKLTADTPEFGRLMYRLVPGLKVYPYRLCDGGGIVLRAKLTLDLTPLTQLPDECRAGEVLRRELTVDLFDPPQRVRFQERVVELRAKGKTEKQVAEALGITVTAAQNAAALDRLMKEQKLVDPYVPVTRPPDDCTKLRRHRHPRYRFEPLKDG